MRAPFHITTTYEKLKRMHSILGYGTTWIRKLKHEQNILATALTSSCTKPNTPASNVAIYTYMKNEEMRIATQAGWTKSIEIGCILISESF